MTDAVSCPLGELLDLSGTGMRVRVSRGQTVGVGSVVPVKLGTPSGSVSVQARVMWRKRSGWFGGFETGFRFEGVTPGQSVALATIARFGFITEDNVAMAQGGASVGSAGTDRVETGGGPDGIHSSRRAEASPALTDSYEKLGLPPGADAAEVKHAYRLLARQCHPDVAPGADNQRRFVELREAYDLIVKNVGRAG